MTDFTITWTTADGIAEQDTGLPIRQVYVWIITADDRVVIVSKDGKAWQCPGGKPEPGEPMLRAGVREVAEETGLFIAGYPVDFIGYYRIHENGADYLQVRYVVRLDVPHTALRLSPDQEDTVQASEDVVRYVEAVSVDELLRRIPWLGGTEELACLGL